MENKDFKTVKISLKNGRLSDIEFQEIFRQVSDKFM